jgi:hypothetical protein
MENIQKPLKLKGGFLAETPIICFWHYTLMKNVTNVLEELF